MPKSDLKRISIADRKVHLQYEEAEPVPLGNLHERMKHVIDLYQKKNLPGDSLWHAICDLKTEVQYHRPADPPFGRRIN